MAWLYLILASLCEVVWASGMKFTQGFSSRPWLSLGTALVSVASFLLLALAMRTLDLSTSYAVWTGLGAVGAVAGGIFLFAGPARWGVSSASP